MTDSEEVPAMDRPYLLGRTFRLTWRMVSAQWSILWLAAITVAISLVWDLIPFLWDWRHFVGMIRALPAAAGHGGPPMLTTLPAPSEGVRIANITLEVLGVFVFFPYLQAAFIGGVIRAVADRVALHEFWRDGFRSFGRSYLAFIGSMIFFICLVAFGGLWSLIFVRLVGHGIGYFIGVIGDLSLFAFMLSALSLVCFGIFQSGWAGFGRALRILRQRWGRMYALGWIMILTLVAAAAPFPVALLALTPHTHVHMAERFPFFSIWGGVIMLLAFAIVTLLEFFYIAWFLIYYRRMNGMSLGPWAPANLQAPDASP